MGGANVFLRSTIQQKVPIFVLNVIFAKRLPQEGFHSDIGVPQAILIVEHVLKILTLWVGIIFPLTTYYT